MSNASRREYIALLQKHYQNSTRYIRSLILYEITRNLCVHRKHAIRLMNADLRPRKSPGRKSTYTLEVKEALKKFWLASRQMCSKKIKESMEDWLPMFDCAESIKIELRKMSPATMDRGTSIGQGKLSPQEEHWDSTQSAAQKHHPSETT